MIEFFFSLLLVLGLHNIAKGASPETLRYCVPVEKIDLNPFREIVDGKDLAYLMMLKSFISTDENEPGILAKFEFSPDGKIFTGQLRKDLRWRDGKPVTSRDAAFSIAKTLPFRTLGERVKIKGTEHINEIGWSKLQYENIKIIDDSTFTIVFYSDIENLTGVIREALSTNSRHNRFWLTRLQSKEATTNEEVLFKFKAIDVKDTSVLEIEGRKIAILNSKECKSPSFSMFPELFPSLEGLLKMKTPSPSAVIALPNTKRLTPIERKSLIAWIRSAFQGLPEVYGVKEVDGFFLSGESGYDKKNKWPTSNAFEELKNRKLTIAIEIPIYKKFIQDAAEKSGVKFELIPSPTLRNDVDAYVVASGLIEGRYVFLQDALKWIHIDEFLQNAPKTRNSLKAVAALSASTLPPDLKTLSTFESNALSEFSMAPIARRYPTAFSVADLEVCLAWTVKGELSFFRKSLCH